MLRFVAFLLLMLAFSSAEAGETLRCVGTSFPYILEKTDAAPQGVAVDLLELVAQRTGIRCQIEVMPWKRAQALVASGEADLLIGPYRTREREAQMSYVGLPFYLDDMVFYAPVGTSNSWHGNLAELAGVPIGVSRGWTLGSRYEEAKRQLTLDEADTLEQNFRKLVIGRIKLVASNVRNARVVLNSLGLDQRVAPLSPVIQQTAGYMALSHHWAGSELSRTLDTTLRELVKSGQVQQINQRHGLNFPSKDFDWERFRHDELVD